LIRKRTLLRSQIKSKLESRRIKNHIFPQLNKNSP